MKKLIAVSFIFFVCFGGIRVIPYGVKATSGGGSSGGPITYVAQETVSVYDGSATLATDDTVNVPSGASVFIWAGSQSATTYLTGMADTATNTYTVRTQQVQDNATGVMAYSIGVTGNAAMTFTGTFADTTTTRKTLIVLVVSPGSGETITLDIAVTGAGYSASPFQTSTDNTTGTDEVCFAGFQSIASAKVYSNQEIPSATAATVLTSGDGETTAFYRILTSTVASILAETDYTSADHFVGEMLCFKSQ